jgi:hypothetical protein
MIIEGVKMVSQCHLYRWTIWICVFLLSNILSCSKSSESESDSEGELYIKLVDAPAKYQQLNINILNVAIHRVGASWSSVSSNIDGPINLLSLRNGKSKLLLLEKVNVGEYDQIKLRFGYCYVIDENERQIPLTFYTPELEHVLSYGFKVLAGEKVQLSFDFDAYLSVSESYSFKPVIRVENTQFCGWIAGSIVDTNHNAVPATISTWTGIDSVSTYNDTTEYGSFQLSDLPENLYSVTIVPFDTISFYQKRIDSLVVVRQTLTNLGAVILRHR